MWKSKPLGEIARLCSGGTPDKKHSEFYTNGTIPWIRSGELNQNVIFDSEIKITELGLKKSSAQIFPAGTLLIAMYGASIGKIARLGIDAATNQAVCGIFENSEVTLDYLFYFLLFKKPDLIKCGIGGAQPNISQTILKKVIVSYPADILEQRRIVAYIEELFSQLDSGVETLKKAKQQLEVYRQAVYNSAFQGVEVTKPFSDFFEVSGGVTKNSQRSEYQLKMPYLRVANVYYNQIDLSEIKEIGIKENELEKCTLQINDILFVEGNGSKSQIGRVAIWRGELSECVHQNHIIKGRPRSNMLSDYALYYFMSSEGRKQIIDVAKSTSGLYTLSTNKIKELTVPYCELEKQKTIVSEIEERLSEFEQIEKTVKKAIEQAAAIRQSILKKAFEGM